MDMCGHMSVMQIKTQKGSIRDRESRRGLEDDRSLQSVSNSSLYKSRNLNHGAFVSVTAQFNEPQQGSNSDH